MPSTTATRRRLDDGRWHFRHGPIDCTLGADARPGAGGDPVGEGVARAWQRFRGLLDELCTELPLLRADLSSDAAAAVAPRGAVARRMVAACRPYGAEGTFITAMAAVAGSVAEELLGAFGDGDERIARAFVDNGGDIALRLAPGTSYDVGVLVDLPGPGGLPRGRFLVDAGSPVRGIATSGWGGRSLSFGIADAVTVLAPTASAADAAATIVANAVDVDDPRIVRQPASTLRDDSDLGQRLVTCAVPALGGAAVAAALAAGAAVAEDQIARGRIVAAVLVVQGRTRVVGALG